MKSIVYLQFNGQAQEALTFYEKALQGTVEQVTFGAIPQDPPLPAEEQTMIMESRLDFSGNTIMISDVLPSMQAVTGSISPGTNVIISLIDGDPDLNQIYFDHLSQGGTIIMPLSSVPWSSSFGMVKDRFGVIWKFNSDASAFLNQLV
ncbi:VOC family protein [Rossellomorea marisflavi]|uniref:VOC family protein n=1 Tax=Rossellomorea marisflavi TaxID=189381 RepID=UPI00064F11C9|nr:VOC family protein [Rossellomorea marisflavi]KMK95056.1 3-demethylubiquinone-9 3-methyltransferase [Rossellomorea marisflavi]